MSERKAFQLEKSRTPIIAVTLVISGGVVTCVAIATAFADDMRYPLASIVGMIVVLFYMIGLFRLPTIEPLAELKALAMTRKPKTVSYKIRKIRPVSQNGPRRPPSAEDIRQIKGK